MKLFAFVRRARRPSSPVEKVATPEPAPVALEDAVATPEPAPVALEDAAASAEKRRRRPSSSGSAAWKPTLVAISEDATVAAAAATKAKAKAKPAAAAKAKARPSPRAARVDYDDFRHFGAPTVLPAFAPTAFLF